VLKAPNLKIRTATQEQVGAMAEKASLGLPVSPTLLATGDAVIE